MVFFACCDWLDSYFWQWDRWQLSSNSRYEIHYSQKASIVEIFDPESVSLAFLALQLRLKKVKGKKRAIDPCRVSRERRPKPIPRYGNDEREWINTEEVLQRVSWAEVFARWSENPLLNRHRFFCTMKKNFLYVSKRARGHYEIKCH